jgi:hypothetical protein
MNNETAFPAQAFGGLGYTTGMTLRDYFATGALQNFRDQIGSQSDQAWFDQMAQGAYKMADAMLKARTK